MNRRRLFAITSIICFILLACAYVKCIAQEKKNADTTGTTKQMNGHSTAFDPDAAIDHFNKLFQHSIAIDSPDGAFHALINLGIKYSEKQEFAKSREFYTAAIPWARRSVQKDVVAWAYNNIGWSYLDEGDYLRASENLYIALKELNKSTTEPTRIGVNIYNNLGIINVQLGQAGKAMEYYNEAEKMARNGKFYFQLGNSLTNKGEYYNSIHQPDSARKCFIEVMDIGRKINKLDLEAIANYELGNTAIEAGDYPLAITYLQQAISLAKGIYEYIVTDASYALGDAWYHNGEYKKAETILVSALQKTKARNIKSSYVAVYTKLAAVFKAEGKYKEALDCMDSLVAIKDTLTGTAKTTAFNQLEIKYKTAEKDKQIIRNQLLIARQQSKITNEKIWIAAIVCSIFILSLMVIGIYRNARHKERLQAEQIISLQQQNRIGTLKAIVQGEENERGRIARELHDGIGGMLAAAMMRLGNIKHENKEATQTPAYNEAMNMLDQIGDEIRKTAHNLMPEVLQKQDLAEAVRSFCNNMQEDGGIKIDFQSYGPLGDISPDVKLNIYRILQELLKNIKQHARAAHALVQLVMNEQTLAITVEDDGVGFDTKRKNTGIGLYNMETRVRGMGGNYTIESEAGKGTTVYIEFDKKQVTAN